MHFHGDLRSHCGNLRRGGSHSDFGVTNFLSCGEECGEVFGDKFKPIFPGKFNRNVPPKSATLFTPQIQNFITALVLGS